MGGKLISEMRMAHSVAVGRVVVELARQWGGYSEEQMEELFVMGYLHDVGYEFAAEAQGHAAAGGEVLRRAGFAYWREIAYHGVPACEYASRELDLLNAADMHTSPCGEYVSFEQRLADIAERYGEDDSRYRDAATVIEELRTKGYE